MARQVPITITVGGGAQGAAEVNRLTNAFTGLDQATARAGSGGLRSSFSASGLLNTEIQSLASHIPVVGRLFNSLSSDALNYIRQSGKVTAEIRQQRMAFVEFQTLLTKVAQGKGPVSANLFAGFQIDAALRDPKSAFRGFVQEFQKIEDPAVRSAIAVDAFGSKAAKMLPVLESTAAAEAAMAAETTAVGSSLTAVLGPIALVVAAVAILTTGIVLGGKAMFDLTKLAADTGGEIHDLTQKLTFSAETISTLAAAGKTAGVDLGSLSSALGIFNKNITQAYESDTKLAKQFKDFNIDLSDNEKALRQVFQALASLPPGAKQSERAMLAFGRSGKEVLGIVKETNGDIDLATKKYREMALVISTEDAKAADQFGDKLTVLGEKIKMIGVRIGFELMPYAEKLVDKLSELGDKVAPKVSEWSRQTIEHFENVGVAAVKLGQAFVTVNTGGVVENDDGAWLMGKLLKWGTGAGVIIGALDKIGAKLRGIRGEIAKPGVSPEVEAMQRDAASKISDQARIARGDYTFAEKERIESALKSRLDLLTSIKNRTTELGEVTGMVAVQNQLNNMKLEEQAQAYKHLEPVIAGRAKVLDREIVAAQKAFDAKERDIKVTKEAADANKSAADELAGLQERMAQAREQLNQNSEATKLATSELDKFNQRVAAGKYAKVTDAAVMEDLESAYADYGTILQKVSQKKAADKIAESADRVRNSIAGLVADVGQMEASAIPDVQQRAAELFRPLESVADGITRISDLKIDRAKFQPLVDLFKSAPEATDLTKAFDQFWSILDKEVQDNTAPRNIAVLVSLMSRAAQVSRDLAAAQTPLGQAQREYNALLEEQRQLNDPVLMQKRLEIELLRDATEMKLRDFDATVSLAKSERELADATIYHSTQANARVAEFLARTHSITEIVADAKTGVVQTTFDFIDSGLAKVNSKLGRMGNLLTQIESDLIRLAATKFFQWIFGVGPSPGGGQAPGGAGLFPNIFGGGGPGGTPTFAGGFQSSGGGSIGQQLLNMLRGGGRTQYAAGMPFLGSFGADGITAPTTSLSGGVGLPVRPTPWGDILSASGVKLPGGSAGIGARGSIAAMLPLLGLGLGSQLGGQSRFGSILGGAGGLLAGGIGTALLAPSLFGIGTAGGSSAMMAGLFGLLTNPITAIVAGGLLVGALLLNRNAQRRKNETDRASLGESTYQSIINVLNAARDGSYTSVTAALADFDKIKADYFSHISGYDSKTKRIATETWNGKPEQPGYEAYRKLISDTAAQAIANRELGKNMIPEFSHGGLVPYRSNLFSMVTGLTPIKVRPGEVMIPPGGFGVTVPGVDRGYDSVYTMARPGTKVLTRSQAAGARGFLSGGIVDADDSGPTIINVYLENQLTVGKETAGQIVEKGATTSNGQKVIVRVIAGAQADGEIR